LGFDSRTPLHLRGCMSKNVLSELMKASNKLGKISNGCIKNYSNNDITEEDAIKLEDQIGVVLAHIRLATEEFRLRENAIMEGAEDSYRALS